MRLAREGKLITHHTDRAALTLMSLDSVIEKEYSSVTPDMPLGHLVQVISRSHTTFLPVLDQAGTLLGIIDLTKIRHIVFRTELYQKFTVSQLMQPVPTTLGVNDPMEDVMKKFDKTDANYLPITDINNRMIGFISRKRMYTMYRKMVEDLSAE
jgi:CIC family chloride channel protein